MKIAIVGKATKPDTVNGAYSDGYELWGFNPPTPFEEEHFYLYSRWFELHELSVHEERRPWYVDWLREVGGTVNLEVLYAYDAERYGIKAEEFPRDTIHEHFQFGNYHCGSIDWLVARALESWNPSSTSHNLKILGLDFRGNEPDSSRPCLEYWLGYAAGCGVTIEVESKITLKNAQRASWDGKWDVTEAEYGYDVANWPDQPKSTWEAE
jgi:hypothetical protein